MSTTRKQQPTFYDTLQVSPIATQTEIRKSYLKLSLKHHPDKNPTNAEAAKETFVLIGQAYDVLSDPTQRQQYDRELVMNQNTRYTDAAPAGSYESYQQAFDERMANLSEDDLHTIKNVASIVGSIVGSIYGSKLGTKFGGNSNFGRALGETAGSVMGSVVGSQAGVNAVKSVHNQSVDRLVYEEKKRVAKDRGGQGRECECESERESKAMPQRYQSQQQQQQQQQQKDESTAATGSGGFNGFRATLDKSIQDAMNGHLNNTSNSNSNNSANHNHNNNHIDDAVKIYNAVKIFGAVSKLAEIASQRRQQR